MMLLCFGQKPGSFNIDVPDMERHVDANGKCIIPRLMLME